MDADIVAAREARYIAAFEPEARDLHGGNQGSMEVVALMQQLEELDQAAQRSVAAEVESALESQLGEAACLVDDAGRARILGICNKVRKSCARLDEADKRGKLQLELQKTSIGEQYATLQINYMHDKCMMQCAGNQCKSMPQHI